MKLAILFPFLLISFFSFSQKPSKAEIKRHEKEIHYERVVYSEDTVFNSAKPYCLMQKSGSKVMSNYSIHSLNNKELAFFKFNRDGTEVSFEVTFFPTLDRVYIPYMTSYKLAYFLVDNELVSGDSIPAEKKQRVITLFSK